MQRMDDEARRVRRPHAGITLLELMIVLIVIAVLSVVSIPSYRRHTMRVHRTEAKAALLELAANQERFYLQNNRYSLNPAALGFRNALSERGAYSIAITAPRGVTLGWVATASPVPGGGTNGIDMTTDHECTSFSLTSSGMKTATPGANGTNGRCW